MLDYWEGNDSLASTYPNLFMLATNSSSTVNSQTCLFEESQIWGPNFRGWLHQFMGENLHNDLNSLLNLLQSTQRSTTIDVRVWKSHRNDTFTVNSLYRHLTGFQEVNNCFRWIWSTQAPLKANIVIYTCDYHTMNIFLRRIFLIIGVFILHICACFAG